MASLINILVLSRVRRQNLAAVPVIRARHVLNDFSVVVFGSELFLDHIASFLPFMFSVCLYP